MDGVRDSNVFIAMYGSEGLTREAFRTLVMVLVLWVLYLIVDT